MKQKLPLPTDRVDLGDLRRVSPVSRYLGFERGTPIDRYYIESFLHQHADDIQGRILEIGDSTYTQQFGGNRVTKSDILHVTDDNPHATLIGDITRAETLPADTFDCIILTQTLLFIYELEAAVANLYATLKPGGVVLATVPGITPISPMDEKEPWDQYWSFTSLSARRLFEGIFDSTCVTVETHGNALAATAFLQGMAVQELRTDELEPTDPQYQLIISIRAQREKTA